MLFGLLNLPWWGDIIATVILCQITIASVTIYLHRHQTHRALDLHPIVSHFFRFWLWLTTATVTKEWVAIHRKHHANVETKDDPHSPMVYGIRKVLTDGAGLYVAAKKDKVLMEKYGYGTPDDWIERRLYTPYAVAGVVLMLFIDLALFGLAGISMWGIQMMCIPVCAAGIINGIGHYWGYRNFETADASRNVIPLAIFLGGEELHNNHHAFASSAKLSSKWWEVDIGWYYIRLLSFFRLAKIKKLPPVFTIKPGKLSIDADTLKAVFSNRLRVMANYTKEVIVPVYKAEKAQAKDNCRKLFRKTQKLLSREESLMNYTAKQRLAKLLAQYQTLKQVYQFRLKLQEIWSRRSKQLNQAELLEALQTWCKQAESTGIEALKNFAFKLKTYAPVNA